MSLRQLYPDSILPFCLNFCRLHKFSFVYYIYYNQKLTFSNYFKKCKKTLRFWNTALFARIEIIFEKNKTGFKIVLIVF